jgi:hypothetical protein
MGFEQAQIILTGASQDPILRRRNEQEIRSGD